MDTQARSGMSRRAMLAGMGAAGGAVLLGAPLRAAAAAPLSAGATGPGILSAPAGFTTIASAPEANVSYQFRSFFDFLPADTFGAGRNFGGYGVYTPNSADILAVTFDAPPGAVLHDIEWYVENTVAVTWGLGAWHAGTSSSTQLTSGTIAAGTAGVIAKHRSSVPTAVNGPFPHGSRFIAYLNTPIGATAQVNGVRLGFTHGALNPVLLTSPRRVYDSRDHGALLGGTTRTITMPTVVPAAAQAVMLTLSVFDTHGVGGLRAGAGGMTPTASAIRWSHTGDQLANSIDCGISSARKIAINSAAGGGSTHFTLDLLGYIV